MLLEPTMTGRGFAISHFTDRSNSACSLQESSLATEAAIWFGTNEAAPKILVEGEGWKDVPFPPGTIFNTRMHLTQDMVKELLPYLQHFAEHGDLRLPPDG